MLPQDFLPRSSDFIELQLPITLPLLSDIQLDIYASKKMHKMTQKQLVLFVADKYHIDVTKPSIKTAIKWTCLGYKWVPKMNGGTHKFLNQEDTKALIEWIQQHAPTARLAIVYAIHLRKTRNLIACELLIALGMPKIAMNIENE